MTTYRHRVKVSFDPEELAKVTAMAKQFKLPISEMLRRFALGQTLPDPGSFAGAQSIRDLLKVNADQARLGNLLKLALDESDGTWPSTMLARIDGLIAGLQETQDVLKTTVKDIHHQIHPRAAR